MEVFLDTGEVLLARQTSARLLQMAHDHSHPHARLHAYRQAVLVAEALGDLQNAAQWAERALQLIEADEAFHNATEWHAYVRLGDRPEAIVALVRRAELLERHGPLRQAAQTWMQAGDLLTGDEMTARRLRFYQRALTAMGLTPP